MADDTDKVRDRDETAFDFAPSLGAFYPPTTPTGNPPQVTAMPPFSVPGMGLSGPDAAILRALTGAMGRPQVRPAAVPIGGATSGVDLSKGLPGLYQPKRVTMPTAPTAPKRSEFEDAKFPLMGLAMIASAFTRQPAVAAMNAMAAIMKGEREGNREAYQNARAEYQDKLVEAETQQRQELQEYETSYRNRALAWSEKVAAMRAMAAKRKDSPMLSVLAGGGDPGTLLADRARALGKITPAAVMAGRVSKILKDNPGMDYFQAEAKAKVEAKADLDKAKEGTGEPGDPTLTGDALLKTLDPGTAAEVKALSEYRLPVMNFRSEKMQRLVKLATQYNPNFDAMQYQVRFGVKKDFTSGKSAQNVTAMNTLIGHMRSLHDEANNLKNTNWPTLNKPLNEAARLTGDPRLAQFQSNMVAVAEELGRVFKGTVTEGEVNRWLQAVNSAMSPDQLQGALAKISELLGSRVEALGEQYKRGTGSEIDLLSPKSKDALDYIQKNRVGGGPKPGDVMDGFRFKGGDPANQNNWEKVP